MLLGERFEKSVDGRPLAARLLELVGGDVAVVNTQAAVRRDDVDMICFDGFGLCHLHHHHLRPRCQDAGQLALHVRIEVDDDDESHPGVLGERIKQSLQCLDTAGRCANPGNHRFLYRAAGPRLLLSHRPTACNC